MTSLKRLRAGTPKPPRRRMLAEYSRYHVRQFLSVFSVRRIFPPQRRLSCQIEKALMGHLRFFNTEQNKVTPAIEVFLNEPSRSATSGRRAAGKGESVSSSAISARPTRGSDTFFINVSFCEPVGRNR